LSQSGERLDRFAEPLRFDTMPSSPEQASTLLQPDDVPIDLGDVPIRQGKTLTVAGLIHSQHGSTDIASA
jgi:hypothetical protein